LIEVVRVVCVEEVTGGRAFGRRFGAGAGTDGGVVGVNVSGSFSSPLTISAEGSVGDGGGDSDDGTPWTFSESFSSLEVGPERALDIVAGDDARTSSGYFLSLPMVGPVENYAKKMANNAQTPLVEDRTDAQLGARTDSGGRKPSPLPE
jgi:hypothetical protein